MPAQLPDWRTLYEKILYSARACGTFLSIFVFIPVYYFFVRKMSSSESLRRQIRDHQKQAFSYLSVALTHDEKSELSLLNSATSPSPSTNACIFYYSLNSLTFFPQFAEDHMKALDNYKCGLRELENGLRLVPSLSKNALLAAERKFNFSFFSISSSSSSSSSSISKDSRWCD
jgi:hypothetical protein